MATVNSDLPTLLDLAKRMDPDGTPAMLVELLQQNTPILEDAVFQEGNLPTGHQFTSRTGLPSVAWRKYNEGIQPSKSRTGQLTETCGMLAGLSVVDKSEMRLNGQGNNFRLQEDKGFLMSMSNEIEKGLLYHSTATSPEKIQGLAPRFDATTGPAGSQVIKADPAASGNDQTSIWLIGWGPQTVFGIIPKGSNAGFHSENQPDQLWDDGTGKKFPAAVTYYEWQLGLVVKDYRSVVRVCNIDTGAFDANNGVIIDAMSDALEQIYSLDGVRPVFYVNRKIRGFLRKEARKATKNSTLSIENIAGRAMLMFDDVPIHRTDAITNAEATVS